MAIVVRILTACNLFILIGPHVTFFLLAVCVVEQEQEAKHEYGCEGIYPEKDFAESGITCFVTEAFKVIYLLGIANEESSHTLITYKYIIYLSFYILNT